MVVKHCISSEPVLWGLKFDESNLNEMYSQFTQRIWSEFNFRFFMIYLYLRAEGDSGTCSNLGAQKKLSSTSWA